MNVCPGVFHNCSMKHVDNGSSHSRSPSANDPKTSVSGVQHLRCHWSVVRPRGKLNLSADSPTASCAKAEAGTGHTEEKQRSIAGRSQTSQLRRYVHTQTLRLIHKEAFENNLTKTLVSMTLQRCYVESRRCHSRCRGVTTVLDGCRQMRVGIFGTKNGFLEITVRFCGQR